MMTKEEFFENCRKLPKEIKSKSRGATYSHVRMSGDNIGGIKDSKGSFNISVSKLYEAYRKGDYHKTEDLKPYVNGQFHRSPAKAIIDAVIDMYEGRERFKTNSAIMSAIDELCKKENNNICGSLSQENINSKASITEGNVKEGLSPWCGDNPKVLVLGTLPGDDSIINQAYYQQSNNAFYRILDALYDDRNIGESDKEFVLRHKIALWDCLKIADRKGSLDKNIKDESEEPNDLMSFLKEHPTIKHIILNGVGDTTQKFKKYFCELYDKYDVVSLKSSSGVNTKYSIEEKVSDWSVIKKMTD